MTPSSPAAATGARSAPAPRSYRWLLIGILLVAALLRLPALDAAPPGINNDVAYDAVDGLKILQGDLRLWFPGNFGREPAEMYLLAASSFLFGRNEIAIRFPTAAAGLLTVAAAAPLAFRLFRARPDARAVALLAAAVMAVNFWHLFWSRIGFRAILLPLALVIACWWLARAYDGDRRGWAAAGAALGASFYTYTAARIVPMLAALIVAADLLFDRASAQARLGGWARLVAVMALVALPLGVYFAIHPDEFFSRIGQLLPFENERALPVPPPPPERAVVGTLAMFVGDGGSNWVLSLPGRGVFDLAVLPFFLLGVGAALARFTRRGERWLLLWLAVFLLPAILAREGHPNYGRAIGSLPPAMLLAALGMADAGRLAARWMRQPHLLAGAAAVLLAISGAVTAQDYFRVWANHPEVVRAFGVPIARIAKAANAARDGRAVLLLANPARGEAFSYRAFDYLFTGQSGGTLLAAEELAAAWLQRDGWPGRLVEVYDFPPTRLGPDDPREVVDYLLRAAGTRLDERDAGGARRRDYRLIGAPTALAGPSAPLDFGLVRVRVDSVALSADESALAVAATVTVPATAGAPDRLSFQVFDLAGQPVAQSDRPVVDGAGRPPEAWPRPAEERVYAIVPLPAALAAGDYELRVAAYRQDGTATLPARAALRFALAAPLPLPADAPVVRLDRPFAGGTLVGWQAPAERVRPGERLRVSVYWQGPATRFALAVEERAGAPQDVPASVRPQRVPLEVVIPATASGEVTLRLEDDEGSLVLGSIPIVDRPRRFAPPEIARPAAARFGDLIELVGYDPDVVTSPGMALDLTLSWRALRDDLPDLVVSVQLLAGDRVVAARAHRPHGGEAPTTGWRAGEYVLDGYEMIPLPAGVDAVSIVVGVIDAATGRPIPANGATSVRLGPVALPQR
ncbi:MAG: glycosyltransferase family 39 protein [Chloroflexota bacterium]|nr:glycosyltransferase family 39 protein [Dehalococcoidia bacterium]MDW8252411.1 glycosyltransferase family 39 protein [Chloroflexota bacterium]